MFSTSPRRAAPPECFSIESFACLLGCVIMACKKRHLLLGAAAGTFVVLRRLAAKRGVSLLEYVGVHVELCRVAVSAEREAIEASPLCGLGQVGDRCSRFG